MVQAVYTLGDSVSCLVAMPDISEYMTIEEVAGVLGYHVKSVYRIVKRGDLKAERKGVWLVSRDALNEYRETTKGKAKNDPRRGK